MVAIRARPHRFIIGVAPIDYGPRTPPHALWTLCPRTIGRHSRFGLVKCMRHICMVIKQHPLVVEDIQTEKERAWACGNPILPTNRWRHLKVLAFKWADPDISVRHSRQCHFATYCSGRSLSVLNT